MSMQNAAVTAEHPYSIITPSHVPNIFGLAMRPGGNLPAEDQRATDKLNADLAVIDAWEPEEILWIVGHYEEPVPANICPMTGASRLTIIPIGTSYGDKPHSAIDAWLAINASSKISMSRILILCHYDLDRAGAAMAQILGRMGYEPSDAGNRVMEALGCSSLSPIVKSVLDEASRQPFFRNLQYSVRRKSRLNAPGVIVAKHMAHQAREAAFNRRDETVQPLSFYLEKTAHGMGWKNWATLSAMLSRPGLPYPAQDVGRAAVHRTFGLDKVTATDASETSWGNFCARYSPPQDIWTGRAKIFFASIYAALFDRHAQFGTTPSAHDLLEAYTPHGPVGILPTAKDYFMGALDGPGRDQFLTFIQMVPGFSLARLLADEPQRDKTLEHISFLSMQTLKWVGTTYEEGCGRQF